MEDVLREDFDRIAGQVDLSRVYRKTILITGSHGFIGSYLAKMFDYLDICDVHGIDNFIASEKDSLAHVGLDRIRLHDLDITSEFALAGIKADYVLNAASIAAPMFYKKHPLETVRVNVLGTWNVLEWAVKNTPLSLVHFSSSEVYGDPVQVPTPERYWGNASFTGPRAVYDESKRLSETLCATYHREHGVPVKVVRPFNVYGPGNRLDDGRVIPNLMNALLKRKAFTIYGDGSDTRSYCYLSDAVAQILSVLLNGTDGEAYNVGYDMETSLCELVTLAQAAFDGLPPVEYVNAAEAREDAPTRRRPDISKVLEIAPRPLYDLESGLERTLRSYDESPLRSSFR
jgi:dTDP-glucose 4,6-dehydratase/UDP-glucuronate decarboxylase